MGILSDIRAAVAAGEPVDWNRARRLQSMDLALHGQRIADESRARESAADDSMSDLMAEGLGVDVPAWGSGENERTES